MKTNSQFGGGRRANWGCMSVDLSYLWWYDVLLAAESSLFGDLVFGLQ